MVHSLPGAAQLRKNHGLEHATLAVLVERGKARGRLAGYSFPRFFVIVGDVAPDDLEECAAVALARLQAGERELAISANCGTNMAATAVLSAAGAAAGLALRAGRLRMPLAVVGGLAAGMAGRAVGEAVQRAATVDADATSLTISGVSAGQLGPVRVHRVDTTWGPTSQPIQPTAG